MSRSTRRIVLWISTPVVAFAIIGGVLSKATAREDTYPQLRIFADVVDKITGDYVDKVNVDKVMTGAMHGLADSLDPDSAYLNADQVKQIESNAPLPAGDVGLDLTRQYYLRVIATRDGSPADKAGLRTGDYVRIIGDMPTREMSVYEGMRRLRGAPGTKVTLTIIRGSTSDPHVVELTREAAADERRHQQDRRARRRLRADRRRRPADRRSGEGADCRSRQGRRVQTDRRRAPRVRRFARRRHRAGQVVRSERHADRQGNTRRRQGNDRRGEAATAASACPTTLLIDTGTSGARGALRVGARRQQARRTHRRTHDRSRGAAEISAAARWQRSLAHDDAIPHAGRRRRCTRRASNRPSPSTNRMSNSDSRRRRPTRFSTRRSSASVRKRPLAAVPVARRGPSGLQISYTERSSNALIFKM